MDVVYICRAGDNEELRYSIRSVVSNLPHDNLWIVGQKPDWYTGKFIDIAPMSSKYATARNNLKRLALSNEISEDFILMNDDFFILNKIDILPVMRGKTLKEKIIQYESLTKETSYTRSLESTMNWIKKYIDVDPVDYELHVPMAMTRSGLLKSLRCPWFWRSAYGNIFNIGGIEIEDVKVYDTDSKLYKKSFDINNKTDFISSDDTSFDVVYESILKDKFPNRSQYEKLL